MYQIHTCSKRRWYVDEFLLPSLVLQGIKEEEILIFEDRDQEGNLEATLKSFEILPNASGTWHLQDDVVVSRNFAEFTSKNRPEKEILCGFCTKRYQKEGIKNIGKVKPKDMWMSFPCIYIPNHLAHKFVKWVRELAWKNETYKKWIDTGKYDDTLFKVFVTLKYDENYPVTNLKPHLVDHVDFLLGGSLVSPTREVETRAEYFEDGDLVDELIFKLSNASEQKGKV